MMPEHGMEQVVAQLTRLAAVYHDDGERRESYRNLSQEVQALAEQVKEYSLDGQSLNRLLFTRFMKNSSAATGRRPACHSSATSSRRFAAEPAGRTESLASVGDWFSPIRSLNHEPRTAHRRSRRPRHRNFRVLPSRRRQWGDRPQLQRELNAAVTDIDTYSQGDKKVRSQFYRGLQVELAARYGPETGRELITLVRESSRPAGKAQPALS